VVPARFTVTVLPFASLRVMLLPEIEPTVPGDSRSARSGVMPIPPATISEARIGQSRGSGTRGCPEATGREADCTNDPR